nr:hypothetical protein [Mycobacterium lacus]
MEWRQHQHGLRRRRQWKYRLLQRRQRQLGQL